MEAEIVQVWKHDLVLIFAKAGNGDLEGYMLSSCLSGLVPCEQGYKSRQET